jgi:hypothetical protein
MKRNIILFLLLGVVLISCESDEVTMRELELKVGMEQHNYNTVFKGIPVKFYCQLWDTIQKFPNLKLKWDLGDGSFSEEKVFYHTYTENIDYLPKLSIWDGKNEIIFQQDPHHGYNLSFIVSTYPKILGDTAINEAGINIFKNGSDYSILYKTESTEGQKELFIKAVDSQFNEKTTTELSMVSSLDSIFSFLNTQGNIVIVTSNLFYEFSISGVFIKNAPKNKNYCSIISTTTGYSAISIENNKLYKSILNSNFEIIQYNEIYIGSTEELTNFRIIDAEHCETGIYFVLLKSNNYDSYLLLEVNTFEGSITDNFVYFENIETVQRSSGKNLIVGKKHNNFYLYEIEGYSLNYEVLPKHNLYYSDTTLLPNIFCDLDANIAFHSNMQISKIHENPNEYFLGFRYDLFNNATKTSSGNFVILGTKQELTDGATYPKKYNKDLLLIEVDVNGKPIN